MGSLKSFMQPEAEQSKPSVTTKKSQAKSSSGSSLAGFMQAKADPAPVATEPKTNPKIKAPAGGSLQEVKPNGNIVYRTPSGALWEYDKDGNRTVTIPDLPKTGVWNNFGAGLKDTVGKVTKPVYDNTIKKAADYLADGFTQDEKFINDASTKNIGSHVASLIFNNSKYYVNKVTDKLAETKMFKEAAEGYNAIEAGEVQGSLLEYMMPELLGNVVETSKSFSGRGVANVIDTMVAAPLNFASRAIYGKSNKLGDFMSGFADEMRGEFTTERSKAVSEQKFGWDKVTNPDFWMTSVAENIPVTLAYMKAAQSMMKGTSKLTSLMGQSKFAKVAAGVINYGAGGITMRAFEGSAEAEDAYKQAKQKGMSDEEARKAGVQVFKNNMALAGLDGLQLAVALMPIKGGSSILRTILAETAALAGEAVSEGGEEIYQYKITQDALGNKMTLKELLNDPQARESGFIGGAMGIAFGLGGRVSELNHEEIKEQYMDEVSKKLPEDLQQQYGQASTSKEKQNVLDGIAETNPTAIEQAVTAVETDIKRGAGATRDLFDEIGNTPTPQQVLQEIEAGNSPDAVALNYSGFMGIENAQAYVNEVIANAEKIAAKNVDVVKPVTQEDIKTTIEQPKSAKLELPEAITSEVSPEQKNLALEAFKPVKEKYESLYQEATTIDRSTPEGTARYEDVINQIVNLEDQVIQAAQRNVKEVSPADIKKSEKPVVSRETITKQEATSKGVYENKHKSVAEILGGKQQYEALIASFGGGKQAQEVFDKAGFFKRNVSPSEFLKNLPDNQTTKEIKKQIAELEKPALDNKPKKKTSKKQSDVKPITFFEGDTAEFDSNPVLLEIENYKDMLISQLENSEAGKRIEVDGEFTGISSTFPSWIPEIARSTVVVKAVLEHIKNNTIPKGSRQLALYEAMSDKITAYEEMAKNTLQEVSTEGQLDMVKIDQSIADTQSLIEQTNEQGTTTTEDGSTQETQSESPEVEGVAFKLKDNKAKIAELEQKFDDIALAKSKTENKTAIKNYEKAQKLIADQLYDLARFKNKPTIETPSDKYSRVINLQEKEDLDYLARVFSADRIEEFKKGNFTDHRGHDKAYFEDILRAKIVSEKPQSIADKLKDKIVPVSLNGSKLFHGTSAENTRSILDKGFKKGSQLSETAFRGGGYGAMQDSISFSLDPLIASSFTGMANKGVVFEVPLKPNANIVHVVGVDYAEDLNEFVPELRKQGIDAVYIPAEKEVAIINPEMIGEIANYKEFKVGNAKEELLAFTQEIEDPLFKEQEDGSMLTDGGEFLRDFQERFKIDFDYHIVDRIIARNVGEAEKELSKEGWGVTYDNTIAIVKDAIEGTSKHEVVHLTLSNMHTIPVFQKMGLNKQDILEAKAVEMGKQPTSWTEKEVEEQLALDFEHYGQGTYKPTGIIAKFFEILKKALQKFKEAITRTNGDVIRQYYDALLHAKAVNQEVVRIENQGKLQHFIRNNVIDFNLDPQGNLGFKIKDQKDHPLIANPMAESENLKNLMFSLGLELNGKAERMAELAEIIEGIDDTRAKMQADQVTELVKYANKNQELPDLQSNNSKFATKGEGILAELGFDSLEEARQQLKEYIENKAKYDLTRKEIAAVRSDINALRTQAKEVREAKKHIERRLKANQKRVADIYRGIDMGSRETAKEKDRYFKKTVNKAVKEGIKQKFVQSIEAKKSGKYLDNKFSMYKRRQALRMVEQVSQIPTATLKEIIGRSNIESMTDPQFQRLLDTIMAKANEVTEKEALKQEIQTIIMVKNLSRYDNLRSALGYPTFSNMTKEQLIEFRDEIAKYEFGDVFLSKRELETIHRTRFEGIRTARELINKLNSVGISTEELDGEQIGVDSFQFENGNTLSAKSPFFAWLVQERIAAKVETIKATQSFKRELDDLVTAARKSESRGIVGRIVPTDDAVFQYLDTGIGYENMTKEQQALADFLKNKFKQAYIYLHDNYGLNSKWDNYITHIRRGFLETLKDTGSIGQALKEMWEADKQTEEVFNLMNTKTGQVLAFEKFLPYLLKREGGINPTKNVARVAMQYFNAIENKKALDKFVPEAMLAVHAYNAMQGTTDKGLQINPQFETAVKEFLNAAKGRNIKFITTQGSNFDVFIKRLTKVIRLKFLGLNIISALANVVGDTIALSTLMATKPSSFVKSIYRIATSPVKSFRVAKNITNLFEENPIEGLLDPAANLPTRLGNAMMFGFGLTGFIANNMYVTGQLTKEEFQTGLIENARIKELANEMNRVKVNNFYIGSLAGETAVGKMLTLFGNWMFPMASTMYAQLHTLRKNAFVNDPSRFYINPEGLAAWSKKEGKYFASTVATAGLMVLLVQAIKAGIDDDDELLKKVTREMNTILSALINPLDPNSYSVVISQIGEVVKLAQLIWTQEEYTKSGDGYNAGDKKYIKQLKKVITPSFIKQFESKDPIGKLSEKETTMYNLLKHHEDLGFNDGQTKSEVAALSDEDRKVYNQIKKKFFAKNKPQVEGEVSQKDFLSQVATYAKAVGTDPVTAFEVILDGEKIKRVDNKTIIVERMSLEESQQIKKDSDSNNPDYKLDHTIPLELGGTNAAGNLKIVPTDDWKSYTPVENYLAKMLKKGSVNKKDAQQAIKDFKNGELSFDQIKEKYK